VLALALSLALDARAHPFEAEIYGHSGMLTVDAQRVLLAYTVEVPTRPLMEEMAQFLGPGKLRADDEDNRRFTEQQLATLESGLSLEVDGLRVPWRRVPDARPTGVGDRRFVVFALSLEAPLEPGGHDLLVVDGNYRGLQGVYEWDVSIAEPLAIAESSLYKVAGGRLVEDRSGEWHIDERDRELSVRVVPDDGFEARLNRKIEAWSGRTPEPFRPGRERLAEVHGNPLRLFVEGDVDARVAVLGIAFAVVLGALHAFSPGHGRTLVAAYLLGPRQTIGHAFWLAVIVTITHTASVAALGLAALALRAGTDPAAFLPWTELLSGIVVAVIGVRLLWARLGTGHTHEHPAGDTDCAEHVHHVVDHAAHPVDEEAHAAEHARAIADAGAHWRSLVALGMSGGLVPCPGAMVILLTALSVHRAGFGLVLVTAFSLGLGIVLFVLGSLIVSVGGRIGPRRKSRFALRVLPVASAVAVAGIGLAIALAGVQSVVAQRASSGTEAGP
jgi:ABC-type nickel/cobalt efflux system permease component RcnA